VDARAAWTRKYAREPAPWRGGGDAAFAARHLASAPPGWVLDLGAGGGKTHRALAAALPDRRLLALDWVAVSLGGAREAAVGDATRPPLRAGACAGVVASHLLGALDADGRARAASAIVDLLAPKGIAVVVDFARGDLRDGAGRRVEDATYERDGLLAHYFAPGEVERLLPGLSPVEVVEAEAPTRFAGPRRRVLAAFHRV